MTPDISTDMISKAESQISQIVADAFSKAFPDAALPPFTVQIPADRQNGDFACNVALTGAKALGMPPRKLAEALAELFNFDEGFFSGCQIAGPGFLNFYLRPQWYAQVVAAIAANPASYGRSSYGKGEKVQVEFVSANPTGPMHMGNARGGALGDCLAAVLDWAGFDVSREFYVNDAGNQIENFGLSLEARYIQHYKGEAAFAFPEDGYHGEDITDLAKEYAENFGDSLLAADSRERRDKLVAYALPRNITKMKADLERYRIAYDVWFNESTLHSGPIDEILKLLDSRGLTYEQDGALWYKASSFGAEKDEVLIRQNGSPTYFAADIAYHYNKFAVRGFSRVIDVWGADHHGHVARLKGAMDAIGLDGTKLDVVLMQLVRMLKDGKPFKMSKRTGRSITLSDLIDDIPVDAARFFFNLREPNSSFDFNLDLALEQSSENPVYYVQYAHARICSILKVMATSGFDSAVNTENLALLNTADEIELIRHLAKLPQEIIAAAREYNPSRITKYLVDLAALFHKFYNSCPVKSADEDLRSARITLCTVTKEVIGNLLNMLKIEAPESM